MAIISAEDAKFRSLNGKKYYEIEKSIEKAILKASEEGRCYCTVSIDINTVKEIRERTIAYLTSLGYEVEITDYAKNEAGCPCDQAHYYDDININWGGSNVK